MKLTLERDAAIAAVGKVRGVVLSNSTIPILQHLLLSARAGELSVTATDMDIEASATAAAVGEAAAAVTVPAGRLHDLLRQLPAGAQVAMELDGGRLKVASGRSRFLLPTLAAGDYPTFAGDGAEHQAELPAKVLARLIDKAGFCMSSETTRYYLCGLYLQVVTVDGEARLRAVATDGGRLGYAETPCPDGWTGAPAFTLPRKSVAELRRMIDGAGGEVALSTNGKLLRAELAPWAFASKLLDANFPDYTRVIPRELPRRVDLDVTELVAGLKRCAVMTGDKTRMVRMALEPGALTLKARDGAGGEAEERIEAEYDGDSIELSFNSTFLVDIASAMSGERVVLELGGPNDPAKLTDPKDAGVTYVCMPLRA